ncbi:MAG: 1-deoxy-D-xylulose-5-phosphate synthase [Elusimicrobia bacterium]|nr:1-deoxy-D-xylulose-5-phosphate synthase [Elusimicrobiota bacterium]
MPLLDQIHSPADLRKLHPDILPDVAQEVREKILEAVSQVGGHLGASLGAAELTTALHYVFNTPEDRLVWDTGHQGYGHKVLTGRSPQLKTIRQMDGISGFLRRGESVYDTFGAGHASTAISAALGMAVARDQKKENHKVIAIVSDGCLTGGMAYEALQNAGNLGTDLLVVLNDNQMFISSRVGSFGAMLSRLLTRKTMRQAEKEIKNFVLKIPVLGHRLLRVLQRAKVLLSPSMLFEELGFAYYGPIDGHDTRSLVATLARIREFKGPIFLHVVTQKGKGYPPAEKNPIKYHGLARFDLETGQSLGAPAKAPTYTEVFSKTLLTLAEQDSSIIAVTAAMPEGTGLDAFRDKYPKRYYDVGLAEQHAVTFAAGAACDGLKPVVAIYSTFLQRSFDQILHDAALQKLPVVFALDRAGLVGEDGPTHHGAFDLSYLRLIPNLIVMAPADENELQHMLKTALCARRPAALRYPRGAAEGVPLDPAPQMLPIGKGVQIQKGRDVTFLSIGTRLSACRKAALALEAQGISCGIVNMRFIKPLDTDLLAQVAAQTPALVTVEENTIAGGFGSAVLEGLAQRSGPAVKVLRLAIPDSFVEHGNTALLLDKVGLSADKIASQVAGWLQASAARPDGEKITS